MLAEATAPSTELPGVSALKSGRSLLCHYLADLSTGERISPPTQFNDSGIDCCFKKPPNQPKALLLCWVAFKNHLLGVMKGEI